MCKRNEIKAAKDKREREREREFNFTSSHKKKISKISPGHVINSDSLINHKPLLPVPRTSVSSLSQSRKKRVNSNSHLSSVFEFD